LILILIHWTARLFCHSKLSLTFCYVPNDYVTQLEKSLEFLDFHFRRIIAVADAQCMLEDKWHYEIVWKSELNTSVSFEFSTQFSTMFTHTKSMLQRIEHDNVKVLKKSSTLLLIIEQCNVTGIFQYQSDQKILITRLQVSMFALLNYCINPNFGKGHVMWSSQIEFIFLTKSDNWW